MEGADDAGSGTGIWGATRGHSTSVADAPAGNAIRLGSRRVEYCEMAAVPTAAARGRADVSGSLEIHQNEVRGLQVPQYPSECEQYDAMR